MLSDTDVNNQTDPADMQNQQEIDQMQEAGRNESDLTRILMVTSSQCVIHETQVR